MEVGIDMEATLDTVGTITGRVTLKHSTLRHTLQNNIAVCNGSIATARGRYFAFRAWNELATGLFTFASGQNELEVPPIVDIRGYLQDEKWVDSAGSQRHTQVFVVTEFTPVEVQPQLPIAPVSRAASRAASKTRTTVRRPQRPIRPNPETLVMSEELAAEINSYS